MGNDVCLHPSWRLNLLHYDAKTDDLGTMRRVVEQLARQTSLSSLPMLRHWDNLYTGEGSLGGASSGLIVRGNSEAANAFSRCSRTL